MTDIRGGEDAVKISAARLAGLNFWAGDRHEIDFRKRRRSEREVEFGKSIPVGKFGIIIADMMVTEIDISPVAHKHCLLLLGCRGAQLPHAIDTLKKSSFTYKSSFVQVLSEGQSDGWVIDFTVYWLIAAKGKGKLPAPAMGTQWASVQKTDDLNLMSRFAAEFFPSVPAVDLRKRETAE